MGYLDPLGFGASASFGFLQVACLSRLLEVSLDAGWGNSGDSGVLVYLHRNRMPGDLEDQSPVEEMAQ